ncbi:hypothetical protein ACI4A9_28460, partial [Klebsiella pneumoniae]|uniref:hypothetical protein n=1 Tax=Klebsiella pneumoniae TaxID=573 RepID=UPI003851B833
RTLFDFTADVIHAPYEIFFPIRKKIERGFDDSLEAFSLMYLSAFSSEVIFRVESFRGTIGLDFVFNIIFRVSC